MCLGVTKQSDKSVSTLANSISKLKSLNTLNLNYGNDDNPLQIFVFKLLIDGCNQVTESGWSALFSHLKSTFESLESLTINLGNTHFNISPEIKLFICLENTKQSDKSITTLANSISQLKSLNSLNLNYSNDDNPLRIFCF